MKSTIQGLGLWLPEYIRKNDEWPASFVRTGGQENGKELTNIESREGDLCDQIASRYLKKEKGDPFLGAKERRVAAEGMTAVEAETQAARMALHEANVKSQEIDVVFSWALAPDRISPASAPAVAHALGIQPSWAMGVDVGCASVVAQLAIATSLIKSGVIRYALCTQSHLMTKTFSFMHPVSPTFGDAATAFVVGPSEKGGIAAFHSVTHGEYYSSIMWRRGNAEGDTPWWKAGGDFYLGSCDKERASYLAHNAVRMGVQTIQELMEKSGRSIANTQAIIATQPRRWIPPAIAEAIGLEAKIAPQTFETYGHLGACGSIVNLLEARRLGLLQPGAQIVLYAPGMGFTRAAVVMDYP